MPDESAVTETGQPSTAVPVGATVPKKRNRGLMIALGALAVLAVIGGIAAALIMFVFQAPNEVEVRTPGATTPQQSATATTQTAASAKPAPAVANDEVFTFRDVFKPLAGKSVTTTTTATENTTDTIDVNEYAADTLYLVSIGSDSGTPYANMVWNSKTYKLNEGDAIPDTPWKVLTIRTSDVVMLYGDQQVVLSVGQGISK